MQPESPGLLKGIQVIREGGIIAYPTETFYGLGVDPFNPKAVKKVFEIKKRSATKPILLLIPHLDYLSFLVKEVTPLAKRLIAGFWPGPLTLVLDASDEVPLSLTAGSGTIGVRLSSSPVVSVLLKNLGSALTATSANRSGSPPPHSPLQVQSALGDAVDLILDGGSAPGGLPSTVVDARGKEFHLFREGKIRSWELVSGLAKLGMATRNPQDTLKEFSI